MYKMSNQDVNLKFKRISTSRVAFWYVFMYNLINLSWIAMKNVDSSRQAFKLLLQKLNILHTMR